LATITSFLKLLAKFGRVNKCVNDNVGYRNFCYTERMTRSEQRGIAVERIVVVGGGYAGLAALGELRQLSRDKDVILIDPGDGHELIPELPEALRQHDPIEEHIVYYKDILQGTGIQHVKRRVEQVSAQQRTVTLDSGETLGYDWLLLSVGSVPAFPPIAGLKERALPLRNALDTRVIKSRLKYAEHQRIVIVGGGLTGVEVAGILAPDHDVWLIEGAPRLLPALGIGLAQYAKERLVRAGVKVILGQKLVAVHEKTLALERDAIHYDVLIWAGGIAPPAWLKTTDLPLDSQGYPVADVRGMVLPRTFVAGDIWRVQIGNDWIP
jgi:NADH dehydrogenase